MSIKITHDAKSGQWSFSFVRHLVSALGFTFLGFGLAALVTPWWWHLLVAVFGTANVPLDDGINYWVSIPLIVLGLGVLAIKYFVLDPQTARREQDRTSIAASPPNVIAVARYFDDLVDDHSYRSSRDSQFSHSQTQFAGPATGLQDKKTDLLFKQYVEAAKTLHFFVKTNFFTFPNNQGQNSDYRYCMTPHLNMDREMLAYDAGKVAKYDELEQQLSQKVAAARQAYDAFITRLRELGHI
ncbi:MULTISPECIES: hypothetical protein [unclassified Rhizobium]|uniref:hypothetical protein n=1 Tax=unclassified Rhizobium TaxID=2613769 RepID=UPI002B260EB4|nr:MULTISPECIES: hypothetical protein [unclassified Rhizobium]